MEFCEICKSMMNITPNGYVCPKCGNKVEFNLDIIKKSKPREDKPEPVYKGGGEENSLIVKRSCPNCGNPKSYKLITTIIGEHAGVNTDRSIIRYKCTKCYHTWLEN